MVLVSVNYRQHHITSPSLAVSSLLSMHQGAFIQECHFAATKPLNLPWFLASNKKQAARVSCPLLQAYDVLHVVKLVQSACFMSAVHRSLALCTNEDPSQPCDDGWAVESPCRDVTISGDSNNCLAQAEGVKLTGAKQKNSVRTRKPKQNRPPKCNKRKSASAASAVMTSMLHTTSGTQCGCHCKNMERVKCKANITVPCTNGCKKHRQAENSCYFLISQIVLTLRGGALTVRVKAWCRSSCGLKVLALCVKVFFGATVSHEMEVRKCVRLVVVPFAVLFVAGRGNSLEVRARSLVPYAFFAAKIILLLAGACHIGGASQPRAKRVC